MAARPPITEAELAARVVAHLEDLHWKVHQEVEGDVGRADIVAVRGTELLVVEAKKALSFDLLAQADRWQKYASGVYIAVPEAKISHGRSMAFRCVKMLGLGCVEVKSLWPHEVGRVPAIVEKVGLLSSRNPRPRLFDPRLRDSLRGEHQTHAKAGTNKGGHVTPFRLMCERLAEYAEAHPGELLRVPLSRMEYPFSSIGNAIAKLMAIDAADLAKLGIRVEDDIRGPKLYPAEVSQERERETTEGASA